MSDRPGAAEGTDGAVHSRRWWATRVGGGVIVAGLIVTALALGTGRNDGQVAADATPPGERSTSTASTTSTTSSTTTTTSASGTPATSVAPSTAAPTTAAPTTAAPSTTPPAPPATEAPAAPPAPARPPLDAGPFTVLAIGDSTGFTASYPIATASERPPYISSIDTGAVLACGLLNIAGWTPVDTYGEGYDSFGLCASQAGHELEGLSRRPDWVVMFFGGWEHIPWIPPGATEPWPARSPELRSALVAELVRRGLGVHSIGARTALVTWACPSGTHPARAGDYAHWFNAVLRDAARQIPEAIVIEPTAKVCAGGDASSFPTREKDAAYGHEFHPVDKRWLWHEWLGPALRG